MFDVSWEDPTMETVGQRRNRIEHDQNTATPGIRRASTSSDSPRLNTAKSRPSILTLLLNGSRKDFSRPASRARLSAPEREPVPELPRSRAGRVGNTISHIQELPPGTLTSDVLQDRFVVTEFPGSKSRDNYSPADESAFTSWASKSASTDSTWSSMADSPQKSNFVQPLSPTSFVTQRTEVTVASSEDVKDNEKYLTVVHISADGKGSSVTHDLLPRRSPSSSISEIHTADLYYSEKTSNTSQLRDVNIQPFDTQSISNVTKGNLWKAPENWEYTSLPVPPPKSSARPPWRPNNDETNSIRSNVSQLQKSLLRRMRTASSKIMLERLTEEWTDPADATINEELEFEKQLWMRTALYAMTQDGSESSGSASKPAASSSEVVKILSLYEDHASLAFHSTLHPASSQIHHLSTTPSPSGTTYNLTVPSPKPHLPYASHLFTAIHASLSVPSLLPGPSLPTLLKECRRVLHERGRLHLTLLDPCPVAASTGPRMREWLDSHLLLGLERKFRCVSPCRLVPGWLEEAGFGAEGVRVTRIRFVAATGRGVEGSCSPLWGRGGKGPAEEETREELRGVLGRMMWEECWGGFCADAVEEGARRWWEDKEVMEECVEMGTAWVILVVEASKEG